MKNKRFENIAWKCGGSLIKWGVEGSGGGGKSVMRIKGATKLQPWIIFVSATKIGRNTTNILNCYFQNKFTLWHIRLNIYIWKTKFTSNKQCFPGHLFSRNAKKTHTDQSIVQAFLLCLKINVSWTFKSSSCKKLFPKLVYHWYNLLRWIFFIPCDNCK